MQDRLFAIWFIQILNSHFRFNHFSTVDYRLWHSVRTIVLLLLLSFFLILFLFICRWNKTCKLLISSKWKRGTIIYHESWIIIRFPFFPTRIQSIIATHITNRKYTHFYIHLNTPTHDQRFTVHTFTVSFFFSSNNSYLQEEKEKRTIHFFMFGW